MAEELSVRVRRFRAEDAEAIGRLEAQCFTMPWSAKAFRELTLDAQSVGLVAEMDDQIVGFCSVTNVSGEGDVNNVAVAPEFQGRGIATSMLKELIRQGEMLGITDFTLEVRAGNAAAIHLYEKLGFVSEGIRPRFYEKPTEDAEIMWRRQTPTIPTFF